MLFNTARNVKADPGLIFSASPITLRNVDSSVLSCSSLSFCNDSGWYSGATFTSVVVGVSTIGGFSSTVVVVGVVAVTGAGVVVGVVEAGSVAAAAASSSIVDTIDATRSEASFSFIAETAF